MRLIRRGRGTIGRRGAEAKRATSPESWEEGGAKEVGVTKSI